MTVCNVLLNGYWQSIYYALLIVIRPITNTIPYVYGKRASWSADLKRYILKN